DVSLNGLRQQLNPDNAFALVARFFKSFGAVLTDGFLIVFTVLFLLFEATVLPRKFDIMPKTDREHRSLAIFGSFVESVQRYVFLKTVLSLALGILVSLVLWGLGVRYAPLWGLLAFLLNFVPNIGAFLSAIPPILLALLQGGWPLFGYTAGILFVIHFVTGNLIEPVLMGGRLGLSTLVVFVSLIFWGWVLGPVGMLLSVPLTMIIRIGFETNPETRWLAVLLGPAPEPEHETRLIALWRRWRERMHQKSR
ncbi:MAG: AI-2E family transporter, partial [Gammaproteobacteria bacterium]